jgi:DNA helicase HerA-like ATPase
MTDLGGAADNVMGEDAVGRVLGTEDATPLDFWVALAPGKIVQLDEVVACSRTLPDGEVLRIFGVVSQVRARHVGARYDDDVFLIADGKLPAEVVEAAQVAPTRFEPEVFVPPRPGAPVRIATGEERELALYEDAMDSALTVGLTRDEQALKVNMEFVDGTRGAHVNISGISGVATKTTYATFLLHSLFQGGQLGDDTHNHKALIFNVKGEDLLFLDKANARLDDTHRAKYGVMGLPAAPFADVGFWAPPRKDDPAAAPDVNARTQGISSFFWSLEELCRDELLPFLFAEAEDDRAQLTSVIQSVTSRLKADATAAGQGAVRLPGVPEPIRSFRALCDAIIGKLESDIDDERIQWAGRSVAGGTVNAFIRRLSSSIRHVERLIRADVPGDASHRVSTDGHQVTVVDLHSLNDRAKRFVVGVTIRKAFEDKERSGQNRPFLFLVLDELNKYAPREGYSPIKEILLDVAERGRSLGIILIGAQQTASEVERRIIANSSIRVVGRLDAAEAGRDDYGFLPTTQRQRATILKPGTMILSQPQVPVPLVLGFPFPAWATKADECAPEPPSEQTAANIDRYKRGGR